MGLRQALNFKNQKNKKINMYKDIHNNNLN